MTAATTAALKTPLPEAMTASEFSLRMGVSRDTVRRLFVLEQLVVEWQPRINLVGRATLTDIWRRHMLDSAQLVDMAPGGATWLDVGSGAGFPGLVVAICGGVRVHLVEADSRKCAFLREAARKTGANVDVHNRRIEDLEPLDADVITARAVAPLRRLLALCAPQIKTSTLCLLPKGHNVDVELTEATKYWKLSLEILPSISDPRGRILRIEGVVPC